MNVTDDGTLKGFHMEPTTETAGRIPPASWRAIDPFGDIKGTPPPDRNRTMAHLNATVATSLAHVRRHLEAAAAAPDAVSKNFNLNHAINHVGETIEHHQKIMGQFEDYWPEVAAELKLLDIAVHEPMPWKDGG